MSDIVERLRAEATDNRRYEVSGTLATEAADEITRLTAEVEQNAIDLEEYRRDVERLRAALGRMLLEFDFMVEREVIPDVRNDIIFVEARAALSGDKR
jgi:seryl-tRNA synthetase